MLVFQFSGTAVVVFIICVGFGMLAEQSGHYRIRDRLADAAGLALLTAIGGGAYILLALIWGF